MSELVRQHLGAAAAQLHERLLAVHEAARPARSAVRRIVLNLLCGAYHDFRSPAPMPKADLVEALRGLPPDAAAQPLVTALIVDVLAGYFADPAPGAAPAAAVPAPAAAAPPVKLTARQRAVLGWLIRYREVYGDSPTGKQIAAGLGLAEMRVSTALAQLERKGAIVRLNGLIPKGAP